MYLKGEKSREQILEAVEPLVIERGFAGLTLQEMLHAASVTKGKFFHHFKTKEILYEEILRRAVSRHKFLNFHEMSSAESGATPYKRLMHILDAIIEWHTSGLPGLLRLMQLSILTFSPSAPEVVRLAELLQANIAVIRQLIQDCQQLNQLPRSLDADVIARLFPSAGIGGSSVGLLCNDKKTTLKNISELKKMIELLSKSCCAGEG